jgi:hypothetical protein
MNLSSAQNAISSCDPTAKLRHRKDYLESHLEIPMQMTVMMVMSISLIIGLEVSIITTSGEGVFK